MDEFQPELGLDNTNDSSNVDMDFHQLLTRACLLYTSRCV